MIVRPQAFDELLDCAALAEEEGEPRGEGEARRRRFAMEVDRAVKKALGATWPGELAFRTATLRTFACRLYFFRRTERVYLVACVALTRNAHEDPP